MSSNPAYSFPPFRLVLAQRLLLREDVPVKLGGRAYDVLLVLLERRDRVVGKGELMDLAWPKLVVEENNLQVQIVALRKLLGHPAIATIPGRGYRFTLPVVQVGGDAPEPPIALPSHAAGTGNLPAEPPPLIGRGDDLRRLVDLMDAHKLVTVAGAAGIGKTRLAQAAAVARAAATPDGAWWVDLAPLADTARVPDAVAITLALSLGTATDATATVAAALRDKSPLLVLDNAEHLLEGVAAFVTRLRASVPGARVLVTSQEPLRIEDECVFRPDPLSLPDGDTPERIAASGAVSLFVARAKAADRQFELRPDNQATVAEICRRLDGIPLAIELAAARVALLGVEGLRAKLDQRFHVLTTGSRASLQRHQTLRAALDWSHHLLSPAEQAVLRRLGVFVGGFTLEAAQQVAEDDDGIDRWDVLEHLGALVDKSLVVAEGEPVPRYRFLETTRLFALERLIDSGELMATRSRHRDWFLHLVEASQPTLLTNEAQRTMARLDLERDNLLAALAWAPQPEDARAGLRLAQATHYYWFLHSMPRRGLEVARAALDRPGADARSLDRCRTLVMAGWLGMCVGQDSEPLECLDEALRLARELGDDRTLSHALARFAHVRHTRGEYALARDLALEALDIGRRLGDSIELGEALMQAGHVHKQDGDPGAAERLFAEALAMRLRLGNASGAISCCTCLGELAIDMGRPEVARGHIEQALGLMVGVELPLAGDHCLFIVSEWAAATGHAETAVLLNAAHERQQRNSGFSNQFEPFQSERMLRAGESLDEAVRARLRMAGFGLGYEGALEVARVFVRETAAANP